MLRETFTLSVVELRGILRSRALGAFVLTALAVTLLSNSATVFWLSSAPGTVRFVAMDLAWLAAGIAALVAVYAHQLNEPPSADALRLRLRSAASISIAGLVASVATGVMIWCILSAVAVGTTAAPEVLEVGWWNATIRTSAFILLAAALASAVSAFVRPSIALPLTLAIICSSIVATPEILDRLDSMRFLWPDFSLLQLSHESGANPLPIACLAAAQALALIGLAQLSRLARTH